MRRKSDEFSVMSTNIASQKNKSQRGSSCIGSGSHLKFEN